MAAPRSTNLDGWELFFAATVEELGYESLLVTVKCKREEGSLVRLVTHSIKTAHKGSGCGVFYNTAQPQTVCMYIRYIRTFIPHTATHTYVSTYMYVCMRLDHER